MKLFVFLGASGSGKSEIQHRLPIRFLTNYTTRELRKGEIDGYHIKAVTNERFEELVKENKIIENTYYAGNYYGTPTGSIVELLNGTPFHATLDIAGVNKLRQLLGKERLVVIYIKAPDIETLVKRMRQRGDSDQKIQSRVRQLKTTNELDNEVNADYVVVNDELKDAVIETMCIVIKELSKCITDDAIKT